MSPLVHANVFHLNKSRFRGLQGCAAIVTAFYLGIGIETAAQASNREQVAPAPDRQCTPPNLPAYQEALRKGSPAALEKGKESVDVRREYGLADLIDLAEQLNPATRAAWQNARQAL